MSQPQGFIEASKGNTDGKVIMLILYVDDILIACQDMSKVQELKTLLRKAFDMKDLGAAQNILGMEIMRDRDKGKSWLSQGKYIFKALEKFNILDCKPMSTPLTEHFRLSAQECPSSDKEKDEKSKVSYANAGTKKFGILFERRQGKACVSSYVNSDYAGDLDNRRSLWGMLSLVVKDWSKHIDVRYHEIRDWVNHVDIAIKKVHTYENASDCLTKPVTTEKFKHCLCLLNLAAC
ncbi:hypothetical protein L3X38_024174 [Prunus dulcis]|uniref:Reverse transcriptase Ty1/copia-type domain-containing protein n=1 Tax=Prunus dulcis TaxID=3755 RepID=A0AAD4Z664_PRUDU|nr:hypothetical protein L3X38_024174 [Prunus dulcis]